VGGPCVRLDEYGTPERLRRLDGAKLTSVERTDHCGVVDLFHGIDEWYDGNARVGTGVADRRRDGFGQLRWGQRPCGVMNKHDVDVVGKHGECLAYRVVATLTTRYDV